MNPHPRSRPWPRIKFPGKSPSENFVNQSRPERPASAGEPFRHGENPGRRPGACRQVGWLGKPPHETVKNGGVETSARIKQKHSTISRPLTHRAIDESAVTGVRSHDFAVGQQFAARSGKNAPWTRRRPFSCFRNCANQRPARCQVIIEEPLHEDTKPTLARTGRGGLAWGIASSRVRAFEENVRTAAVPLNCAGSAIPKLLARPPGRAAI